MNRTRRAPARAALLLGVLVLAVSACGGDESSSAPATSTTAAPGASTSTTVPSVPAVDPYDGHTSEVYDGAEGWICRPDLPDDSCRDLDVTVVAPDGTRTVEPREPAADPPIDCFYVYPTVSEDPGTNSDLEVAPGDAEDLTVVAQAAQYARTCRVFAPIYRQVTLVALGGGGFATGGDVAYADVLDAWKTYVSTWNDGRGVLLIGHSQGTGHLKRLISEEIDGNDVLGPRLVAAHLFGGAILAPEGADVGGSFDSVPACREADQIGCVVTWSSYPASSPPVPGAIFGKAVDGDRALCTDAVDLLGRTRGSAVVPVAAPLVGGVDELTGFDTPFVSLPEAVEVECAATESHDYLAVTTVDDDRPLEGLEHQRLGETWGLHLFDVNLALDDLVELASREAAGYTPVGER